MGNKFLTFLVLFLLAVPIPSTFAVTDGVFLGASLYFSPLAENVKAGSNFTVTIKADSLAQPINAISAGFTYNPDRLEIISTSRIGSIFSTWVEEPNYSNLEGKLNFQGGLPNPGFIGNGGTVLHVIFKSKSSGVQSLIWEKAEVLANDGKGTNILTNLLNYDFVSEEQASFTEQKESPPLFKNFLIILNLVLLIALGLVGLRYFIKSALKSHDQELHEHLTPHDENSDKKSAKSHDQELHEHLTQHDENTDKKST